MPKKKKNEITIRSSAAEYLTYVASVGGEESSVEMRYEDENIWLTQKMMATLYDVSVPAINQHLKRIFDDGELVEGSVIKKYLITAADGKSYLTNHYNLQAIIAVGFKVNNERAVQFRKWAGQIVKDYTIQGWTMDVERLKKGTLFTDEYFERQLENIREIRLSERKFYQKVTDLYATAFDYDKDASYIHICQNNTIFGTQYVEVPQVEGVPLVADMSSMILSKPVDVTKYGCIYFGVQKNVAPAGMAIAIVRDDLLGHAADNVPTMMNYTTLLNKDSMYNTPPCWCIYMTGLVLKYLENDIGGLANMQKINEAKAKVLYDYLDGQEFFTNPVEHRYRSTMNVTFTSPNPDMDKKFCAAATEAGFVNLKGHRLVGGMRASIYNAMPAQGVNDLVGFMEKFRKENA